MSELKDFQKLVISNAEHAKGMLVGDKAPDFNLPNALGKTISLSQCLKSGPVILKFYRGEWCPHCNLDLREIQNHIEEIKALGVQVLAVSPQNPNAALTITQKNDLVFDVLSDSNQEVIRAYNLQFDPGQDYHQKRDLTLLNGDGSITLPVPATFIITSDSVIVTSHVDTNYTERMPVEEILNILKKL
ncbi:MAG: alkyl hydroperoxide reductase [Planctomycetota bacterium]|nr:MAG: alkyl hydroperoxide reductase [Planctomycetota bacterium]